MPDPSPTSRLRLHALHEIDAAALAAEAADGLAAPQARVAPKFFYDALGSRLFEAITELPEYDLARTEAAIFAEHGAAIVDAAVAALGPQPVLVDLGAGNGAKAARLFATLHPRRYVAVDIAIEFLRRSLQSLQREHPSVEMVGVGLDFSARLVLPPGCVDAPVLVFYPGSSIGNFARVDALRLLREARRLAACSALLVGVDLVKDRRELEAAYDDELGVTAAFNLNLLRHLNRLLGADFRPRDWRHLARYDAAASRIEMHLEARTEVTVRWRGGSRRFAAGERIHTENSAKWTVAGFESLLHEAGCARVQHWTDRAGRFAVFLADG
jgi:dimethylhistidine N-methyltransferase